MSVFSLAENWQKSDRFTPYFLLFVFSKMKVSLIADLGVPLLGKVNINITD